MVTLSQTENSECKLCGTTENVRRKYLVKSYTELVGIYKGYMKLVDVLSADIIGRNQKYRNHGFSVEAVGL